MRDWTRIARRYQAAVVLAAIAGGCTDPTTPSDGGKNNAKGVNEFMATLGPWTDFAPAESDSNTPTGSDTTRLEVVLEPNNDGVLQPVTYVCKDQLYSMTATPSDLVLYEPNASIMWVGNLIQGRSYRDGQGSFQELSIRQRAPLKLSIDLLTGANSATVEQPSLSTVNAAIGDLIQQATDAGHRSGSTIHYELETTHSVQQSALALGLSASHLGVRARADLQVSRSANERTISVHFVQKMFTIAIELPQSPASMFSSELTNALLQQQIDDGNIGPANPPVYLASITYGRVLTYNLTSTHTEQRIRAAIQASYTGLTGGAAGYTEAQLRETLDRENVQLTSIGGEGQNVLDLIATGNLKSYFATDAPLTTARPISYQLNYLGDNTTARVAEKASYTLRDCAPRADIPGPFRYLPSLNLDVPIPTPYQVVSGDVDGDRIADLIFNHLSAGSNELAVALGSADGSFGTPVRSTHSAPAPAPEGWTRYILQSGDITGDGQADLVWHSPDHPGRVYTAVGAGSGFSFPERMEHPISLGTEFKLRLADVNADSAQDLVWNRTISGSNLTYVAPALRDGRFEVNTTDHTNTRGTGWGGYHLHIADVNGDGRDDLVWNNLDATSPNRVYVGLSLPAGGFNFLTPQDHPATCCWSTYTSLIGDFNRDRASDMLWINTENFIHRGAGQGTGRFSYAAGQPLTGNDNTTPGVGPFQLFTGDVDGDGARDVIWNRRSGTANRIAVTRGVPGQNVMDRSDPAQMHPDAANWLQAQMLVGDFNGDQQDDVLWVIPGGTTRVFVAIARTPGV